MGTFCKYLKYNNKLGLKNKKKRGKSLEKIVEKKKIF